MAENPKYPARLPPGTCSGFGFAYAVAPWPVAPHTHVECPYCRSRLPGPWPHGTNESDLGSRLTLDRGILALRSEFGRAARIRGRLVSGLTPRVPDRVGTLAMFFWAASGSCPRPSAQSRLEAKRRLHAPFCCTCTRFSAVPPGAFSNSCCTSRRFFAVLVRAFCCTSRRFWAGPRRPRIHPRKRKQAREEPRLPRILPT